MENQKNPEQRKKKPRNKNEINRFWNFVSNQDGSTAELLLYGEISNYSWYGDEITPKEFNNDLKAIGAVSEIIVRINSGGGDVFAAMAIYTRLKEHKAKITVKIDGWAASAATIIAMAGDVVEIPSSGVFMVHDPSAGVMGYYTADDFVKMAEELTVIKQSIVNCYMTKCGMSEDEIKNLMSTETWYTGSEAVEAGFCDVVMFEEKVDTKIENASKIIVNSIEIRLDEFTTIPRGLLGYQNLNNKPMNDSNENKEDMNMTLEEFKAKHPELVTAIQNEVKAGEGTGAGQNNTNEAVNAERARIKAIDDCTLPGYENLANEAKYTKPITAEAFAMQIIAEQKKQGKNFLNDREEDVKNSGMGSVTPQNNKGLTPGEDTDPYGDIIDKMLPETK